MGHVGGQDAREPVPRLVEALSGKKVIGVAGGPGGAACVWTDAGEHVGHGECGQLGHGGTQNELVPKLVEALAEKKVIGAAAGFEHTVVWTNEGELFTFGDGDSGKLGHGGEENEDVPRLLKALVGTKVVGAAAGDKHIAVWTEAGDLFTFGKGLCGRLGHGGAQGELVSRLVEALAGKKVVGASIGRL